MLELGSVNVNLKELNGLITLSVEGNQIISIDKESWKHIALEVLKMCAPLVAVSMKANAPLLTNQKLIDHLIYLRDGVDTPEMHCDPVPVGSSWRYVIDKALE